MLTPARRIDIPVDYKCNDNNNNNNNDNNNNIQFLETHNTIKIVSMRVKNKH